MPAHPAETGCAARTSASTPSIRRTSATSSGSGWCSCARSAVNSRLSATIRCGRAASSGLRGPDRRSASARHAASASRAADATTPSTDDRSAPGPSSSTARRHNAATSEAPEPPARPGQHPHRGDPRRGVGGQPQHRDDVGDLRACANSPASPTTSTGTPRAVSASAIGAASALRRTRTAVVGTGTPDARASSYRRATWSATQSRSVDTSVNNAHRTSPGRASGRGISSRTATDRRRACDGDRVGQLQGPRRVAPAGAQFERGRGGAVRTAEVGGEPRQVGRRGAAPSVDRLDGIPDRGQGQFVVDSPAEQRRQRDALSVTGVLVLVEQHHPVPLRAVGRPPWGTSTQAAPPRPSACRSP